MARDLTALNNDLYRVLKNEYPADIFPQASCRSTELGNGDTFFSVEQIATTINSYYKQCKKIASLLEKNTLQKTCKAIHQFLYWHFQYKADGALQKLRSPACSWRQRYEGIDCKSYSILAGSILKMLGYNFYIRQVKQLLSETPNDFTHVYIIVPIDQKNNDLKKGYYVIDGTVPTTDELPYIIPVDYLVMKHIGLNGRQRNYLTGLGVTITPVGGDYTLGNPNAPSSPVGGGGGSKWSRVDSYVTAFVDSLKIGVDGYVTIRDAINGKAGTTVIPNNVVTKEDFYAWMQRQQNSANGDKTAELLLSILPMLMGNKKDYTVWIIGGVAFLLLVVGGGFLLMNSKK